MKIIKLRIASKILGAFLKAGINEFEINKGFLYPYCFFWIFCARPIRTFCKLWMQMCKKLHIFKHLQTAKTFFYQYLLILIKF